MVSWALHNKCCCWKLLVSLFRNSLAALSVHPRARHSLPISFPCVLCVFFISIVYLVSCVRVCACVCGFSCSSVAATRAITNARYISCVSQQLRLPRHYHKFALYVRVYRAWMCTSYWRFLFPFDSGFLSLPLLSALRSYLAEPKTTTKQFHWYFPMSVAQQRKYACARSG